MSNHQVHLENRGEKAPNAAASTTRPLPSVEKGEEGPSLASISSPAQRSSNVLPAENTPSSPSSEGHTASNEEGSSTSVRIYRKANKDIDDRLLALDQAVESDLMREQSASGELMGKYGKTKDV